MLADAIPGFPRECFEIDHDIAKKLCRNIQSECPDWERHFPIPLSLIRLSLQVLSDTVEARPEYLHVVKLHLTGNAPPPPPVSSRSKKHKQQRYYATNIPLTNPRSCLPSTQETSLMAMLVAELSLEIPLEISIPEIDDDRYWKRKTLSIGRTVEEPDSDSEQEDPFSIPEIEVPVNHRWIEWPNWKARYLGTTLSRELAKLVTGENFPAGSVLSVLQSAAPFIQCLEITEIKRLPKPYQSAPSTASGENLLECIQDEEDDEETEIDFERQVDTQAVTEHEPVVPVAHVDPYVDFPKRPPQEAARARWRTVRNISRLVSTRPLTTRRVMAQEEETTFEPSLAVAAPVEKEYTSIDLGTFFHHLSALECVVVQLRFRCGSEFSWDAIKIPPFLIQDLCRGLLKDGSGANLKTLCVHQSRLENHHIRSLLPEFSFTRLTRLGLAHNKITCDASGLGWIVERVLKDMCLLEELVLDHNEIGSEGGKLLSRLLCRRPSKLRVLSVNLNRLGEGASDVVSALEKNISLKVLKLAGNMISDQIFETLAAIVVKNSCIEEIDLSSNVFTDESAVQFIDRVESQERKNLVKVDFRTSGISGGVRTRLAALLSKV